MLPSFDVLVAGALESTRPYRWLVKQSRCRACASVHERAPVLMRETKTGWAFEAVDDGTHESAPVVFEEIQLVWCEHCNSRAAQDLTKDVRLAIDMYSNSTTLAIRLRKILREYDVAKEKEKFHHA